MNVSLAGGTFVVFGHTMMIHVAAPPGGFANVARVSTTQCSPCICGALAMLWENDLLCGEMRQRTGMECCVGMHRNR